MNRQDECLFTPTDHAIVRAAVRRLPGLLAKVIELRFWQQYTIAEIGSILGVPDHEIERVLRRSYHALRNDCLRHPGFSRSLHSMLKKLEWKESA